MVMKMIHDQEEADDALAVEQDVSSSECPVVAVVVVDYYYYYCPQLLLFPVSLYKSAVSVFVVLQMMMIVMMIVWDHDHELQHCLQL